jgi:(E)-4-hydroxy-3-methylbut-2-enyl-diphosphate synthase
MVYLSGVTDHHVKDAEMIDHIVRLVEQKAAEIEASDASAGGRSQSEPASDEQPTLDAAE